VMTQSSLVEHKGFRQEYGHEGDIGVFFNETPYQLHLNLRCNSSDLDALRAAREILNVDLRIQCNTFEETNSHSIFWLSPDEWLLMGMEEDPTLEERLSDAWKPFFHSIVDLSGGQTVIRVSGAKTIEILNLGCTLDLHPRSFKVNCCAQSLIHGIPILLSRHSNTDSESPIFELMVRRSYADCLMRWLIDSATYHGFRSTVGL
jgi:sarcosine oxidase subunit gamma